jgi:hypothetical protein
MIAAVFPKGRREVKLADFAGAPLAGVQITSESDLSRQHGVRKGHVIVAIDGIACDTQRQFQGS